MGFTACLLFMIFAFSELAYAQRIRDSFRKAAAGNSSSDPWARVRYGKDKEDKKSYSKEEEKKEEQEKIPEELKKEQELKEAENKSNQLKKEEELKQVNIKWEKDREAALKWAQEEPKRVACDKYLKDKVEQMSPEKMMMLYYAWLKKSTRSASDLSYLPSKDIPFSKDASTFYFAVKSFKPCVPNKKMHIIFPENVDFDFFEYRDSDFTNMDLFFMKDGRSLNKEDTSKRLRYSDKEFDYLTTPPNKENPTNSD